MSESVNGHVLVILSFEIIKSRFGDDTEQQLATTSLWQGLINNLRHDFRAHVHCRFVA